VTSDCGDSFGALRGVKVVDLTMMLAGPYCTMMLADQGADVIKVEPPAGDITRGLGPFQQEDSARHFGGYFQSINRNKRSIVLNLKEEADRDILLQLVAGADVLIENYRCGVMERLGLGYERLREINSRLIYACLRGFGDPRSGESPYMDWPAYDVVAQAMGGVMAITGTTETGPIKTGPGIGDLVPAMMLGFGILAALRHAQKTGQGQFLDIGMYDAMIALCERCIYQYSYEGVIAEPAGNGHPLLCPFGIFPTADGWISIAAHQDNFWRELCKHMGRSDLGIDPRYSTNSARVEHDVEVIGLVGDWTRTHTKAEVASKLAGKVPIGPVHNASDIYHDPHVKVRDMLKRVEQPGSDREAVIVNSPIRMSETPGGVKRRAPLLDEHREEILREMQQPGPGSAPATTTRQPL
jgi:crotonobetainyl-CoA:carnitine CoA-transferase CaiB-like acyl-CoA transferase